MGFIAAIAGIIGTAFQVDSANKQKNAMQQQQRVEQAKQTQMKEQKERESRGSDMQKRAAASQQERDAAQLNNDAGMKPAGAPQGDIPAATPLGQMGGKMQQNRSPILG